MNVHPVVLPNEPSQATIQSTISERLAEFAANVTYEKINRGAGDRALTGHEIAVKFMDNAELVLTRSQAERIRDFVLELDRHGARELGAMLVSGER